MKRDGCWEIDERHSGDSGRQTEERGGRQARRHEDKGAEGMRAGVPFRVPGFIFLVVKRVLRAGRCRSDEIVISKRSIRADHDQLSVGVTVRLTKREQFRIREWRSNGSVPDQVTPKMRRYIRDDILYEFLGG